MTRSPKCVKMVLLVLVLLLLVVILVVVVMLVVRLVGVDVHNGGGGPSVVSGEGSVNMQEEPIQPNSLSQELLHISWIFVFRDLVLVGRGKYWDKLKLHHYTGFKWEHNLEVFKGVGGVVISTELKIEYKCA